MSRLAVTAAFIRRDWQTDLSYRAAFGLEIAGLILGLAIFFYLGRVIDNREFSAEQGLDGGYFGFVAIGLALFQIIRASLGLLLAKAPRRANDWHLRGAAGDAREPFPDHPGERRVRPHHGRP